MTDKYSVQLGLDTAAFQQGIRRAGDAIKGFGTAAKAVIAGVVGGKLYKAIATDFMDYNTKLSNAMQLMGYNVTEWEAFGGVLKRVGGDTGSVVSTLDNLTLSLEQARWGTGSLIEASKKYGITFQKNNGQMMTSEELLKSLHRQLKNYDRQTRLAIGSQIGLDQSIMRAYEMSEGALREKINRQKELNKATQKDLELAGALEDAVEEMREAWSGVMKQISHAVLPALTSFFKKTTDLIMYFRENNYVMPVFFGGAILVGSLLTAKIVGLIIRMGKFTASMVMFGARSARALGAATFGFKGLTFGIKSARMAALGLRSALSWLSIPLMILTAILLIAQDIFYYNKGWKSLLGKVFEQNPKYKEYWDSMVEPVKAFFDLFKNFSLDSWVLTFAVALAAIERQFIMRSLRIIAKTGSTFFPNQKGGKVLKGLKTIGKNVLRGMPVVGTGMALYEGVMELSDLISEKDMDIEAMRQEAIADARASLNAGVASGIHAGVQSPAVAQTNNITINAPGGDPAVIQPAVADAIAQSTNKLTKTLKK